MSIVGGGFLAVLIVATYLFASKPRFGLLTGGLSPSEQGSVIQELGKMGVPYEQDTTGNISVPSDRVPELRAKLAMSGKLSLSHSGTDDELAKLNSFSTPRIERERIKAIAEANLAQDIGYLDGIDSARVHLALADDSPFVSDRKSATASVTVFEKGGASISKDQARGIAMLIAGSVPNLDLNNVTVLNRRGEPLMDPAGDSSNGSKVLAKLETERMESKRREREIQGKLDSAFGPGSTIATVNVEINFKGEEYTEVTRTPGQPLRASETTEKMTGGATAAPAAGISGAGANTPGANNSTPAGGATQGYENKSKQTEYDPALMNERHSKVEDPAGQIKSMAITVLVNKVAPAAGASGTAPTSNTAAVQEFVDSYIGFHKSDPNWTTKVSETTFDTKADAAAATAVGAAASKNMIQQVLSLLPVVALVAVGLMVIKALGKFGKVETLVLATPDGRMVPLPANGLNFSQNSFEQTGGTLQLTQGGASGGTQVAQQVRRKPEEDVDPEVDAIRRKINVPLEQIKKMSEDRPEMVAMLIKTWLMEERR